MPTRIIRDTELPSSRLDKQRLTKKFKRRFHASILPLLKLNGRKMPDRIEWAMHITNLLIKTGLRGRGVGDSRRCQEPGVRMRVQVFDAIIAAGLARIWRPGSEMSGKVTRYRATRKLLDIRKRWQLEHLEDVRLERSTENKIASPHSLVYLHTGKVDLATGDLLPDEQRKQPVSLLQHLKSWRALENEGVRGLDGIVYSLERFKGIENTLERINRVISSFPFQAFCNGHVFPVNACLRQIHVGALYRAARLYSWGELSGQSLPKEMRKEMLIGGERVAELDYSGMAIRMLYHNLNIDPDPAEDIYRPARVFRKFYSRENVSERRKGIIRTFIKKATNTCINAASRQAANSSVGNWLNKSPDAKFLWRTMCREGIDVKKVVRRIIKAHPELAASGCFFSRAGIRLMTDDGTIMLWTLHKFAEANKPALAIHDALVVRAGDVRFAKRAMRETYCRFMRHDPVIHRVY